MTGSIFRGTSMKNGKKQFAVDENRRNTYKQFHPSVSGREPSVLTTFDAEGKHLMAVCITLLSILLFKSLKRKIMQLIAFHGVHEDRWWTNNNQEKY